jgi:hypothetical protein
MNQSCYNKEENMSMRFDVRRVSTILILVVLVMVMTETSAICENSQDKVFLTFMSYPRVGQVVEYAVRAMCGNTCTQARCELVSLTPVSGATKINMSRLENWCYGHGKVNFSTAGKTRVKANVFITNPWGSLVLQDEIELLVHPPGRGNDPGAAPAGGALADDKVYLRFLDFPLASKPIRWAVRAKVGNYNKGASGRITASVPVNGDVFFGLQNKPPLEWAFRQGTITFTQPGLVDIALHVQVRTGTGKIVNLEQKQTVQVGGDFDNEMAPGMTSDSSRDDWQVDFKLMGFPRSGVPIDWSIRGSLGNMVKDVRCQISAAQELKGQTASKMTEQPFGNWHGGGRVTFTEAGMTNVMASIYMKQYGHPLILSKNFSINILARRGHDPDAGKDEILSLSATALVDPEETPTINRDPGVSEIEASRRGYNMISPGSRHLRIRYNLNFGNPAKFRLKPYHAAGHTGEKVVIIDYWGDPNTPIKQLVLKGDQEQELLVLVSPDMGMVGLVEFHWVSGNARSVKIQW